jgi:integrase/DNA-directed RNA polymerase specialized sigma24 family protein
MATQPKSRASVDQRTNAELLGQVLADSEQQLRCQARKHAASADDAEDALQSAFVLFIERYRGDCEPLAWLHTTVKREAWALRRKASRQREVSLDSPCTEADDGRPWVESVAGEAPEPGDLALRAAEVGERRVLFFGLKPDERRALFLLALGFSYRAIATRQGWTYTKVNRCVAEGRAAPSKAAGREGINLSARASNGHGSGSTRRGERRRNRAARSTYRGDERVRDPHQALLHRAKPGRVLGGLRPHDPHLDPPRRAAFLQAGRLAAHRSRRRRDLPRRAARERKALVRRREAPIRRANPSGEVVWVARYTGRDGKRRIAKPAWNGGKGTFLLKRDAQRAIEESYGTAERPDTVGEYFASWSQRYPRSERTNTTNKGRINAVLDIEIEDRPLRDWPLRELRRRHVLALVDQMLRVQGRATTGASNILRSLSAMAEDAITDEATDLNPFKGVRVRANDPRARKDRRPVRVFSFEQMHEFAAHGGPYEPMIRVFTDTGMRLGEVLPLRRRDFDGGTFVVARTADEGRVLEGTKTGHGERFAGRIVPCPPSLAELIATLPTPIDDDGLLFPTPTGKLWRGRNFYRDVWYPTQGASGIDVRPHECRHSWITHLRAAGIDDADLAQVAGHTIDTMLNRYTHPLGRSMDRIRAVVG